MTGQLLAGVRVLDLTSVVVGPGCTWRLGQYGAEIIKVEAPEGDLMRGLGGLSPTGQHSGAYLHLNRGKRNVCLDLKKPGAAAVMEKLVARSDIIVANMRPRALERLGLDAKTIRAKHPEKIYCLITGYGTDGPYAGRPTYDSVVQGVSGMAGLSLVRDGQPDYVPMMICDHVAGEIAAGAILAALARNVKEWFAVRGAALSSKSTAEWLAIFQAVDIAAMPVHSLETLRRDAHLVAVDLVKMEDHPTEGRVAAIRSTIRIDDEYLPRLTPAQPRGAETRVLLHEVGLSASEIDKLMSSGTAIVQQN